MKSKGEIVHGVISPQSRVLLKLIPLAVTLAVRAKPKNPNVIPSSSRKQPLFKLLVISFT